MSAPSTVDEFLDVVRKSGLVEETALAGFLEAVAAAPPDTPTDLASAMLRAGLLTRFQAQQLLLGRSRGFTLGGKYRVLEFLGAGGMGSVYLCEHTAMRRWVAVKVLPADQGKDSSSYVERFYREARASAALDHPNIVRAFDVDHDGKLHFLVMEYVDGVSLQQLVERHGPLDPVRAAHYLCQVALGLQHAHEAGLVHRDVKPANLLLDRTGTVKVLDLGLARFFHEDDGLSKKYDENVLGTTDYLAPEQVIDGKVDIRADIYALGASFYFCLTGSTLFGPGTTAAKLVWQRVRKPRPIRELRPEVPAEMAELIEEKMLAKEPEDRFQEPAEVCAALAPWVHEPIPPPPAAEMPQLCPALSGAIAAGPPKTPTPARVPGIASTTRVGWTGPANTSIRVGTRPSAASSEPSLPDTSISPGKSRSRVGGRTELSISGADTDPARARDTVADTRPPAPRRSGRPRSPAALLVTAMGIAALTGVMLVLTGLAVWWAVSAVSQAPTRPKIVDDEPPVAAAVGGGPPPGVTVTSGPNGQQVRTAAYEAVIGTDGNLSSLRVGGTELLKSGLKFDNHVSRGSYFFFDKENRPGVVKLPKVDRPSHATFKMAGDRFSVTYDFGPEAINLKLTNSTDHSVPFFIVFDRNVTAVMNDKGEVLATPAKADWPTAIFFAGAARLAVSGGNRIWGPWVDGTQVWEATVKTYETRQVTLKAGTTPPGEAAKVKAAKAGAGQAAEAIRLAAAAIAGAPKRVQTPGYEATVEFDGCLTSLRVGGTEFLRPGADVSRGLYLHNGKDVVPLPEVEQPQKDVITAKGPDAAVRYEFAPHAVTCTVENKSKAPMNCFLVFDPAASVLRDGPGEWLKLPLVRPAGPAEPRWETTSWFAPGARLKVTGASQVWGPWSDQKLTILEASLKPHEARKVVLEPGTPTDAEAQKFTELTGKPARTEISLTSPGDYEVFQRRSRLEGPVRLGGWVHVPCDRLEVRLSGTSLKGALSEPWREVPLAGPAGRFDHTLQVPAGGWYRVELRALKGGTAVGSAQVEHVGVGEVFVVAGQSNATNCSPDRTKPVSGMVASFDGYHWRPADDPQPGVHDHSGGGSCWPALGDALYARYHVPVGIAATGHSGTSVNQWQPGGELFRWTVTRLHQLGPNGFRAVLWHQGESDVGMSSNEYADRLAAVIRGSHEAAGWDFPWFVARVSYHNPEHPSFPSTRDGQKKLWDSGVALEGPDTDTLTGDNRSEGGKGIHFSAKGLRAHGQLWADKVGAYLDRVLDR
jgi:serine/threonine protein kinase